MNNCPLKHHGPPKRHQAQPLRWREEGSEGRRKEDKRVNGKFLAWTAGGTVPSQSWPQPRDEESQASLYTSLSACDLICQRQKFSFAGLM